MAEQRLVDANALKQELERRQSWQSEKTASRFKEGFDCGLEAALEDIVAAPTVPAVVLPCEIGETVYARYMECNTPYLPDNCTDWRTAHDVEMGSSCEECPHGHPVAIEKKFDYSDIPKFGKTIFFTREKAEAALRRAEG